MEPEDNIEEEIEDLRATLESMGLPSDYGNPDYCVYAVAVLQYCAAGYVTLLWILLSTPSCLIEDTCLLFSRTAFLPDAFYCTLDDYLKDQCVNYCTLDFD